VLQQRWNGGQSNCRPTAAGTRASASTTAAEKALGTATVGAVALFLPKASHYALRLVCGCRIVWVCVYDTRYDVVHSHDCLYKLVMIVCIAYRSQTKFKTIIIIIQASNIGKAENFRDLAQLKR